MRTRTPFKKKVLDIVVFSPYLVNIHVGTPLAENEPQTPDTMETPTLQYYVDSMVVDIADIHLAYIEAIESPSLFDDPEFYAEDCGYAPATVIRWKEEYGEDADEIREYAEDMALSVEVRSGWTKQGETLEAGEYKIVTTTGGPHIEVTGVFDGDSPQVQGYWGGKEAKRSPKGDQVKALRWFAGLFIVSGY